MANETIITGLVLDTPQPNGNRYQQMVSLDAVNLAALQAAEKALRADGKGGNTKRVIWGRPGHEYVYTNSSLDAALPGSGKEVGNKVTVILVASNDGRYLNALAQVSETAKAAIDKAKLEDLRKQAAASKENKAMLALLKSLKVNENLSQLALVQKVVGVEIGAGFGAALAAMENSTKENVTRSSRLDAANGKTEETEKVISLNDAKAETPVVVLTAKTITKWENLSEDELQTAMETYAETTDVSVEDVQAAYDIATADTSDVPF